MRHWLRNQADRDLPGGQHVCDRYAGFLGDAPGLLAAARKTDAELDNFLDYSRLVYDWLVNNPAAV